LIVYQTTQLANDLSLSVEKRKENVDKAKQIVIEQRK
jgi:t-SNARE complex subunit (syntaxin)